MATLLHATRQWSSRPADERFNSLASLHDRAMLDYTAGRTSDVQTDKLHVVEQDGDIVLNGAKRSAAFTHWSFGQLCRQAKAPAAFLARPDLPAGPVVELLNQALRTVDQEHGEKPSESSLLFRDDAGRLTTRAITSTEYGRIWNKDITSRLIDLTHNGDGWQPAPAAFDGSRGLYLGDRDMFAFLVDNDRRIFERDKNGGLGRGFFCWNSEVGARTFGICRFLYEFVCGNHRVWGAQNITEVKIRHVGDMDAKAWTRWALSLERYAEGSAEDDEAKIVACRNYEIGATKQELLDVVFGLRIPDLSRKLIEAGYERAVEHEDWYGNPRSCWGLAGGLTEIARDLPNADDRNAVDRAAGKVMAIAF